MRCVGTLTLDRASNFWLMKTEPHVAMMAKRVFGKLPTIGQTFQLKNTQANCMELRWFLQRFPMEVDPIENLIIAADRHVEQIASIDNLFKEGHKPRQFELAVPAREYQQQAADLWLRRKSLLLGDQVGLGKSCAAICGMTDERTQPILVVTLANLPRQWKQEINRFAPDLYCHILEKIVPYALPKRDGYLPDVIISSYHKLNGWCDMLARYCNSIVLDEGQELRNSDSNKYRAAKRITEQVEYKLCLSGTPIYNYGEEFFNVADQLQSGFLGTRDEFSREWLSGKMLKDPDAFGSFLKDQHFMLRRTRKDVSRELPEFQKITVPVESDVKALDDVQGRAGALARIIMSGGAQQRGEAMQAAGEFDALMRQATGISKAPYVASFVEMLLEQETPVLLFGWHHAVYEIWMEQLKKFNPRLYSGHQSTGQKQEAIDAFTKGETNLLIMSLRSGAGVDGLQFRCCTTVHGEFDWSPGVIEQNIGRALRDGQTQPVVSYMMLSDEGCDPLMAEVIGLKTDQIEGIRGRSVELVQRSDNGHTLRRLAEEYLKSRGIS